MKALAVLAALGASLPSGAADVRRDPLAESGLFAAFRAGYGIPLGKFATTSTGSSLSLSDEFSGQIPFWLDVGYRFKGNYVVAGFLQVAYPFLNKDGPGLVARECHITSTSSCSGNASVRLGLEFLYDFMREAQFHPWAGIGAGYERTVYTVEDQGGEGSITYSGWEFLNLQVGGEYRVAPRFTFGPYVSISLAKYNSVDFSSGGQSQSIGIANEELHQWLQFGVKGTFDP
jgi:hypothetical protein